MDALMLLLSQILQNEWVVRRLVIHDRSFTKKQKKSEKRRVDKNFPRNAHMYSLQPWPCSLSWTRCKGRAISTLSWTAICSWRWEIRRRSVLAVWQKKNSMMKKKIVWFVKSYFFHHTLFHVLYFTLFPPC